MHNYTNALVLICKYIYYNDLLILQCVLFNYVVMIKN